MRKDPHGTKAEARRPDRDVRPCLHSFCAGACRPSWLSAEEGFRGLGRLWLGGRRAELIEGLR